MNLELRTVAAMIRMYCRARHGGKGALCRECTELLDYAAARIAGCPFGAAKPVCNKCTVHCYEAEMRSRIQQVMRFAGPRMILRHPVLAIRHLWRSRFAPRSIR